MNATTAVIVMAVIASASSFRVLNWRRDGKIVGGEDAAPGEFPYQLSLRRDGEHWCGASILSKDWALTAAHCFEEWDVSGDSLQLMAGSLHVDEGDIYDVTYFAVHPNYDRGTVDWDMALLKVSTPFVFSSTVSPIALPAEGEELDAGTMVVLSGWGRKWYGGPYAEFLQKVTVPVYDKSECAQAYININGITDRMFCAGVKEGGKNSCNADSGGPVVANDKQYGIISWSKGCAERGYPGVYAKVSSMKAFIAKETGLKK